MLVPLDRLWPVDYATRVVARGDCRALLTDADARVRAPTVLRLHDLAEGLSATVKDFVPSTWELFREADLVLSTCGYNTMTELLVHARRSILVPRVLHREEQRIRARRMEELGLATCLHPEDVTPASMGTAIRAALAGPPGLELARSEGRVPCDGARRFSEFCGTLSLGGAAHRASR